MVKDGALQIIESGAVGDRVLSTRRIFDWTPNKKGDWMQATFDLLADHIDDSEPAIRIAYLLALNDFNDQRGEQGGNILIDGNPAGGAAVLVDYPGDDSRSVGTLGEVGYQAGHNFGVRVTNIGQGQFRLEHLYDGLPDGKSDGKSLTLAAADLPDGAFGFEYCCGRSFIVDNVVIERNDPSLAPAVRTARIEKLQARRKSYDTALQSLNARRRPQPGKIAWVTDISAKMPTVYRLLRGDYKIHGEQVQPAPFAALSEPENPYDLDEIAAGLQQTTGCRLAFARWLTQPNSKASALLARVTVNRIWQHHFGTGIVQTPDNLGHSGAAPTHPELVDWLASYFVQHKWSVKALHRLILTSAVYQPSSVATDAARRLDPDNRLLGRFPLRRLDAEAIRDSMLSVSGELDRRAGGPYVPYLSLSPSQVIVDEKTDGAHRRSICLQHRRTFVVSLLKVFDAPSIVFNCTRRDSTTVALQSLSLLNSDFSRRRASALAARLTEEVGANRDRRISRAFLLVAGREPSTLEFSAARQFLIQQPAAYPDHQDAASRSWVDFCQMLLASNAFLYVE